MHRLIVSLLALMCVGPLAWCGDSKGDEKMLQGTWTPTSAELAGQKFPDETLKTMKLILTAGKYTVKVGNQTDQGTVTFDPAKKPKAMDITGTDGPNKGKTFLAIYELTGDTLKVCYDLSGKARPAEFKTKPDSQLFLVTYQREKP